MGLIHVITVVLKECLRYRLLLFSVTRSRGCRVTRQCPCIDGFSISMQFSDNIFVVDLHKEKIMHVVQFKNTKEDRLLSVQQKGSGHLLDSGGSGSIIAGGPNIGGLLKLASEIG